MEKQQPLAPGGKGKVDFTFDSYALIVDAALRSNQRMYPVIDWYALPEHERRGIMLRHDVDRRPENALTMARLEATRGIRSTYYFRIVGTAFHPDIMREIADLGHEIGYHYEDWHLGRGVPAKSIESFEANLARMREIFPIKSIAMHGSPLARESNLTIWRHIDFKDYGVIDASNSFDYSGYTFFTDSGRTFGASSANIRDYLPGATAEPSVRSSKDLAKYLMHRPASKMQISVHPERWNAVGWPWYRQLAIDMAANTAKVGIRQIYKVKTRSRSA